MGGDQSNNAAGKSFGQKKRGNRPSPSGGSGRQSVATAALVRGPRGGAPPQQQQAKGGLPPECARKAGAVPKKACMLKKVQSIIIQKTLNKHQGHTHEVIKR